MRRFALAPLLLLSAAFGPCQSEPPATTSGEPAGPAPRATQTLRAAPRAAQSTPTVEARMHEHFGQTDELRRALVAGDLPRARRAAAVLSSEEWTPHLREAWRPSVTAVRAAASDIARAGEIETAAAALGALGSACASCHGSFGKPSVPPSSPAIDALPEMARHAAAVERSWWGLFAPSDEAWREGAEALTGAPLVASDVREVEHLVERTYATARRASAAPSAERGALFGALISDCARCHQRVGATIDATSPSSTPPSNARSQP